MGKKKPPPPKQTAGNRKQKQPLITVEIKDHKDVNGGKK